MNYYNENDPKTAAWLRELIRAGEISNGEVDERSIVEVKAHELKGFTQCHFFAGIGGWSVALRLAGWPDDKPVWTGSCPCQPLSCAGQQKGHADERHLWPAFYDLIAECGPATVFGEQVAGKDGREWFAGVRADLEGAGYAVGDSDLCAAGVGSPHRRQRLYWMAYSTNRDGRRGISRTKTGIREDREWRGRLASGGTTGRLADANGGESSDEGLQRGGRLLQQSEDEAARGVADMQQPGLEGHARNGDNGHEPGRLGTNSTGSITARRGAWDSYDLLPCLDGKARRVESPSLKMVDGIPESVAGLLPERIQQIEKEIADHAEKTQTDGAEAVLDVWKSVRAETLRAELGGRAPFSQAAILFSFLCQLQKQGWSFSEGILRAGSEASKKGVRVLWGDDTPSRTSCERGLAGQQPRQSPDPLHLLSSILARHTQEAWGEAIAQNAADCFPLAHGAKGRVMALRGYGNAIVPQLAAEFIKASVEAIGV